MVKDAQVFCCRVASLLAMSMALTGCAQADRDRLAAQGLIEDDAPVKAIAEIIIGAPESKVWDILSDIGAWPRWQPAISQTTLKGPLAAGTPFVWSSVGSTIHSTIQLIDPPHRLAWTGRVFYFHAIHVWTLDTLADGRTRVRTRESMDGWFISRLFPSEDLLESDQQWLARLKQAAEK